MVTRRQRRADARRHSKRHRGAHWAEGGAPLRRGCLKTSQRDGRVRASGAHNRRVQAARHRVAHHRGGGSRAAMRRRRRTAAAVVDGREPPTTTHFEVPCRPQDGRRRFRRDPGATAWDAGLGEAAEPDGGGGGRRASGAARRCTRPRPPRRARPRVVGRVGARDGCKGLRGGVQIVHIEPRLRAKLRRLDGVEHLGVDLERRAFRRWADLADERRGAAKWRRYRGATQRVVEDGRDRWLRE